MPPNQLVDHVLKTYNALRVGMGIIALIFPLALVILGYLVGVEWRTSMSAYYFAPWDAWNIPGKPFPVFQTRVLFSGTLCALGAFLYLYKGFSPLENRLLNAAGICACGVALCPMSFDYGADFPNTEMFKVLGYAHYTFALALFACMAGVVWFCADNTLHYLPTEELRRKFKRRYKIIAIAMGTFPLLALLITQLSEYRTYFTFAAEGLGVLTFSIYWLVKSREMSISDAERQLFGGYRAASGRASVAAEG